MFPATFFSVTVVGQMVKAPPPQREMSAGFIRSRKSGGVSKIWLGHGKPGDAFKKAENRVSQGNILNTSCDEFSEAPPKLTSYTLVTVLLYSTYHFCHV